MTSVSGTNSLLPQLAAVRPQPVEGFPPATAGNAASNTGSSSASPNTTSAIVGDAYVDASQAIVTYLLNQPAAAQSTPASSSTNVAAAGNGASASSATPPSLGAAGGGGGSSSSSTKTIIEKSPDGEIIEIKTDSKGAVISETVVATAPQNSSDTQPNTNKQQFQLPIPGNS